MYQYLSQKQLISPGAGCIGGEKSLCVYKHNSRSFQDMKR